MSSIPLPELICGGVITGVGHVVNMLVTKRPIDSTASLLTVCHGRKIKAWSQGKSAATTFIPSLTWVIGMILSGVVMGEFAVVENWRTCFEEEPHTLGTWWFTSYMLSGLCFGIGAAWHGLKPSRNIISIISGKRWMSMSLLIVSLMVTSALTHTYPVDSTLTYDWTVDPHLVYSIRNIVIGLFLFSLPIIYFTFCERDLSKEIEEKWRKRREMYTSLWCGVATGIGLIVGGSARPSVIRGMFSSRLDTAGWLFAISVALVSVPLRRIKKCRTTKAGAFENAFDQYYKTTESEDDAQNYLKPDPRSKNFHIRMMLGAVLLGYGLCSIGLGSGALLASAGQDFGNLIDITSRFPSWFQSMDASQANQASLSTNDDVPKNSGGVALLLTFWVLVGIKLAPILGAAFFGFDPTKLNGEVGLPVKPEKNKTFKTLVEPQSKLAPDTEVAAYLQRSNREDVMIVDVRKRSNMTESYVVFNTNNQNNNNNKNNENTETSTKKNVVNNDEKINFELLRSLNVTNIPFDTGTGTFICENVDASWATDATATAAITAEFGSKVTRLILVHCDDGWISRLAKDRLKIKYHFTNVCPCTLQQLKEMNFWSKNATPVPVLPAKAQVLLNEETTT